MKHSRIYTLPKDFETMCQHILRHPLLTSFPFEEEDILTTVLEHLYPPFGNNAESKTPWIDPASGEIFVGSLHVFAAIRKAVSELRRLVKRSHGVPMEEEELIDLGGCDPDAYQHEVDMIDHFRHLVEQRCKPGTELLAEAFILQKCYHVHYDDLVRELARHGLIKSTAALKVWSSERLNWLRKHEGSIREIFNPVNRLQRLELLNHFCARRGFALFSPDQDKPFVLTFL